MHRWRDDDYVWLAAVARGSPSMRVLNADHSDLHRRAYIGPRANSAIHNFRSCAVPLMPDILRASVVRMSSSVESLRYVDTVPVGRIDASPTSLDPSTNA